jgi:hypothetical protein
MTVGTTNVRNYFTTDGSTLSFPFTFTLLQASDVEVYVNTVLQTQGSDYTVSPTGGEFPCVGGSIVFISAPAADADPTVPNGVILRETDLEQEVEFEVEESIAETVFETALDKVTMMVQQLADQLSLCLQLPITSTVTGITLPAVTAGSILQWDPTGATNNLVNITPAEIIASVPGAGLGNVIGPTTSTVNNLAAFNNVTGTLLKDPGIPLAKVYTTDGSGGTITLPSGTSVINNVRAYLVSGSPNADGSSSGNTTVYIGPPGAGDLLTWDNGSSVLASKILTEVSVSTSALTSGHMYDLYLSNITGSWVASFSSAWSNTTTPPSRGTDAAGRPCKSGATDQLLVAEPYCSTSGKIYDYYGGLRELANVYNQRRKFVRAQDPTATWTLTSSTGVWSASDGNTTVGQGSVSIVQGSYANLAKAKFKQSFQSDSLQALAAIGLDSTSAAYDNSWAGSYSTATDARGSHMVDFIPSSLTAGHHVLQMLESGVTSNNAIYYGTHSTPGATFGNSYLEGEVWV